MKAQHQGSLLDQIAELIKLANANKLYDATDFLSKKFDLRDSETAVRNYEIRRAALQDAWVAVNALYEDAIDAGAPHAAVALKFACKKLRELLDTNEANKRDS